MDNSRLTARFSYLRLSWEWSGCVPQVSVGFFPPAILSTTCFVSLLTAVMVQAGVAVDRGPTSFGKLESVFCKWTRCHYTCVQNRFWVDFRGENFCNRHRNGRFVEFSSTNKPAIRYGITMELREMWFGMCLEDMLEAAHPPICMISNGDLWEILFRSEQCDFFLNTSLVPFHVSFV